MSLATVVETKELAQTVIFALVAGVGVTAVFSIAIWGSARYAESHGERPAAALAAAAVAGLALLAVVAAVVIGVVVMTSK